MTKYVNWAQVIPFTGNALCDCQTNAQYVINGRTSNLTKTKTNYACKNCINTVIANQEWAGASK